MEAFEVPLNRHHWCPKWCADVHNNLASRQLDWRTATEKLTGNTPDISMFRFHFWAPIQYYDPTIKEPKNGWKNGHFLGFVWNAGDHLTYFVETNKASGRDTVLTRSLVRPVPTNIDNNINNDEVLKNAQMNTDSREEIAFNINNNDNNANNINNNNNTNINNNANNNES